MPGFTQRAVALIADSPRSPALDFGWCRWIELLDPSTHFSRAATALVDPISATTEFRAVATAFVQAAGPHHSEILARLRLLRSAIEDQPQTIGVQPATRNAFRSATVWTEQLPSTQAGWNADYWKTHMLRKRVRQLLNGPQMRNFEREAADPSTGFKATLIARLGARLAASGPLGQPDARALDRELELLASLAIAEGRDPAALASRSLQIWRSASTDADAVSQLQALLQAARRPFVVAVRVQGLRHDFPDASGFGLRAVSSPVRWTSAPSRADRRLQQFVAEHSGPRSVTLLVDVDAYDDAGAWVDALSTVDDAAASIVGEHRVADVNVLARGTVLDCATSTVRSLPVRSAPISRARSFRLRPGDAPGVVGELADSLRQHARSRDEARPAWAAGLGWAALDALANGAEEIDNGVRKFVGAGAFLPPRSSATVSLSAVRYQLINLWKLLRPLARKHLPTEWSELEDWIGATSGSAPGAFVDLPTWAALMRELDPAVADPTTLSNTAPVDLAAARLLAVAAAVSAFHEQLVLEAHERLSNARVLADWCDRLKKRTTVQLQRMRFVRHSVMHTATFHIDAVGQLRQASHDLVDAHYEVLRHWLDGTRRAWQALQAATDHFDSLMASWRSSGTSPALLRADQIIEGP